MGERLQRFKEWRKRIKQPVAVGGREAEDRPIGYEAVDSIDRQAEERRKRKHIESLPIAERIDTFSAVMFKSPGFLDFLNSDENPDFDPKNPFSRRNLPDHLRISVGPSEDEKTYVIDYDTRHGKKLKIEEVRVTEDGHRVANQLGILTVFSYTDGLFFSPLAQHQFNPNIGRVFSNYEALPKIDKLTAKALAQFATEGK